MSAFYSIKDPIKYEGPNARGELAFRWYNPDQVVMGKKDVDEATFQKADHLGQESAIVVRGTVQEHPKHPGNYELIANGLDVVSEAHDFPITPKEHGVDFLMDRRHLWIRSQRQQAILRIRHEVIDAVRELAG